VSVFNFSPTWAIERMGKASYVPVLDETTHMRASPIRLLLQDIALLYN
jgi:hypothetical protein